jgi:hypothetical protein
MIAFSNFKRTVFGKGKHSDRSTNNSKTVEDIKDLKQNQTANHSKHQSRNIDSMNHSKSH